MIEHLIGATEHYIVSGHNGAEYKDELKKLKAELKKQGRQVEAVVVVRAIVITEPIKK